jgi:pyruvate formate lyase activating enzyme
MSASIKGLQKTSVVDYPPYVACTIFISTCNFRCGFCYNSDLVNDSDKLKEYSEDDIMQFLESKKSILDGVCITGGEPTLYKNLKEFIKKIKNKNLKVKLDTNGTNPHIIKDLLDNNLLDYIAMDIKSSKENYDKAAGVKVNIENLNKSIDIIKNSNIDYEFRTTAVPGLIDENIIKDIGEWLKGAKKYAIQQFHPNKNLIDSSLEQKKPYDIKTLERFKDIMGNYVDVVELRA